MAKSAAKLIEENVFYSNGEHVKVIISDTTIGRVAEAAACADKFRKAGVDITLTVTPCWCYGVKTMDMDPMTIKAVWGFNGTERPGTVYLASVLATHAQKGLPGWDESYTSEQLNGLLKEYAGITHEKLFENLVYFLNGIMFACNEAGVNMAIHPDDPPWDIFGLPRIVGKEADYDRLFAAVPDTHNGMTFCTGSLGAGRFNDLPKMAAKYAKRIYFAHLRQLKFVNDTDFYENGHQTAEGNVDIYSIVRALEENGFDGYLRPDHGRNIWGENAKPGYGLFDRALGAAYLAGVFEAVQKDLRK